MPRRASLRAPWILTAALCLSPPSIAAQSSQGTRTCTADATDSTPRVQAASRIVDELVVQDAGSIPTALRDELEDVTRHHSFLETPDSDWTEELQESVREFLQDRGFFRALVEVHTSLLQQDKQEAHYLATAMVRAGAQYRLGDVRFRDNKVFSSDDLRKLIPLQTGELLNVSKIRGGLEAMSRKYGEVDYMDATVEPQTEITEDIKQISLTMIVNEEKRYVVDVVTVLGGDQHLRSIVQSTFARGEVFSKSKWEEFLQKNRALFASYDAEAVQLKRNPAVGTISLIFDLRPCSTGAGL